MSILRWPKQERPRERLLNKSADALSNVELLAILLTKGTVKKSALELARDLLLEFQTLRQLFNADTKILEKQIGMGPAKICVIKAAYELGKRILQEELPEKSVIHCTQDVELFLKVMLRDLPQEVFSALFLDSKHHIIAFEKLFFGSVDYANVHPRELIKRALHHNAAAVIVAHNHPSGNPEPSQQDIDITQLLKKSLEILDIRLLDHIIIGDNQNISLAERGL